ncbi:BTB/POZ domain-containing protein KCTD12 isoform X1 [Neocloeon triangulifer]|uniref:BTB/POZ domain-containing protein KCTD12 isoform X1 n=2 Tax=Neocloeon triangulifer TaxID=2078957 RepID=UPI00286F77C9|nr:BTB/POZ domain-containing protein KCTD12 isoform X1 [Neocloeon triangulifer]
MHKSMSSSQIVELNVGGVIYASSQSTLSSEDAANLKQIMSTSPKDSKGRVFIDRDGVLFRYVLDYLRDKKICLPENFQEKCRLLREFEFFNMENAKKDLQGVDQEMRDVSQSSQTPGRGYITVGYRGSFAFGSAGMADVKFRKLSRILVCGRVTICREVFGESLNESRDPDHGESDRYTSRFFLKHSSMEQAFDCLQEAGFKCVASCGSGTAGALNEPLKPGMDAEENKWNHYNEFVFVRE